MPRFSQKSKTRLQSCDERIQRIFNKVIYRVDCSIICGYRNEEDQNEMFRTGKSQLEFPNGKHNFNPSLAVDVMAYPIDWKDRERATLFAGYVLGVAATMDILLRWGGDWNTNWQVNDNNFDDFAHFELVGD